MMHAADKKVSGGTAGYYRATTISLKPKAMLMILPVPLALLKTSDTNSASPLCDSELGLGTRLPDDRGKWGFVKPFELFNKRLVFAAPCIPPSAICRDIFGLADLAVCRHVTEGVTVPWGVR